MCWAVGQDLRDGQPGVPARVAQAFLPAHAGTAGSAGGVMTRDARPSDAQPPSVPPPHAPRPHPNDKRTNRTLAGNRSVSGV